MDRTVLVVDDERDIVDLLRYNLTQAGFRVVAAFDGRQALDLARRERPDLVVLDLMLPVMPGTEVARLLKSDEKTRGIPILMLTAKGEEVDRVVGFELGADDYVSKPFSPRELILRIRAILRREPAELGAERLVHGSLEIDLSAHEVRISGSPIELTATEFKLLHRLAKRPGHALSREQLLREVWGYGGDIESRTVDTHVKRLRAKLGAVGEWIETLRGVGYRFRPDDLSHTH